MTPKAKKVKGTEQEIYQDGWDDGYTQAKIDFTRPSQEIGVDKIYWCGLFLQELIDLRSYVSFTSRSEDAKTKAEGIEELIIKYQNVLAKAISKGGRDEGLGK